MSLRMNIMFKSVVPGSILVYKQYNIFQRLWAKLTNKELKYNRAILFPSNIELMNTLSRYSEAVLLEPKKPYNKAEQSVIKLEIEKLTDESELYTVEFKNKGIHNLVNIVNSARSKTFSTVTKFDDLLNNKYYNAESLTEEKYWDIYIY